MLSCLIWLTVVAFCWAEKNDAGFEYEAAQGVNSVGYTVLYGDESISVINQVVTDIEKQRALKPKVRLSDGIQPLPATDVKCFMSVDRYCSKEMAHMKGVLIEAIRDDCAKCQTEDKTKAGRIIAALMAHDPVAWKMFLTRSVLQTKEPKKYTAAPKEVKLDIVGEPEDIEQTANKFVKPGFRVRVRRYAAEVVED